MVRLPDEYQEVEYLESTGTQYIDTGYVPVLSPILRMKIRITNQNDKDIAGFVSNVYPSFIIDAVPAQSRWFNRYGGTASHGVNPGPVVGQIQEWEWGKEVKFNGNLVRTNTECDWSSNTQKMNIFRARNTAFVAVYSCSLYDGELVRNLIPCYRKSDSKPGMYDTLSKTFYTNSGTGEFLVGNNVYYDTTNLLESRRRILLTTPHLESPTPTNPLTFKSNMTTKLKEGKVYFTPVQEGTGDPSPDNVRPILGWDGISVTRTGKNIFGGNAMLSAIANTNSTAVINGDEVTFKAVSNNRETIFNKFKENTQYSIIITGYKSMASTHINLAIEYTDGSVSSLRLPSGYVSNEQCTFVYVSTANRTIKCIRNHPANFQNFTLIGSLSGIFEGIVSEDAYEPYTETKITIPFPQTIYGGYVDLVNGEVVEEWCNLTFDGTDSKINRGGYYSASSDYFGAAMVYAVPYAENVGNNVMCDKLKTYGEHMSSDYLPYLFAGPTRRLYLCVVCGKLSEHPEITTDAQRIAFVNNWLNDNPIDVSYKITTPIHHTIDPQVIRPLKGVNNIWSDANGNIEIKFWKH